MKNIFLLTFSILAFSCSYRPKIAIYDYEKPKYYGNFQFTEIARYYDSLREINMQPFLRDYYRSFNEKNIARSDIIRDFSKAEYSFNAMTVSVLSRKTKDGLWYINSQTMQYIKEHNDDLIVTYIHQDDTINSEKGYSQLKKISKKRLQSLSFIEDNNSLYVIIH